MNDKFLDKKCHFIKFGQFQATSTSTQVVKQPGNFFKAIFLTSFFGFVIVITYDNEKK